MKKIVIATLAAFLLGTAAMAQPAEARCWWNGYAWHCWHPHAWWWRWVALLSHPEPYGQRWSTAAPALVPAILPKTEPETRPVPPG